MRRTVIVIVIVAVVGTDDHYDCDEALELSESYQSSPFYHK